MFEPFGLKLLSFFGLQYSFTVFIVIVLISTSDNWLIFVQNSHLSYRTLAISLSQLERGDHISSFVTQCSSPQSVALRDERRNGFVGDYV